MSKDAGTCLNRKPRKIVLIFFVFYDRSDNFANARATKGKAILVPPWLRSWRTSFIHLINIVVMYKDG